MHFFCWYRRENDSLFLSHLGRVELGAGGAVRETLATGVDGLASELLPNRASADALPEDRVARDRVGRTRCGGAGCTLRGEGSALVLALSWGNGSLATRSERQGAPVLISLRTDQPPVSA